MHFKINGNKGYAFNKPSLWERWFVLNDLGVIWLWALMQVFRISFIICSILVIHGLFTALPVEGYVLRVAPMVIFIIAANLCEDLSRKAESARSSILNKQERDRYVMEDELSYVLLFKYLDDEHVPEPKKAFYQAVFAHPNIIKAEKQFLHLNPKEPSQIEEYYRVKRTVLTEVQAAYNNALLRDPKFFELAVRLHEGIDRDLHEGARQLVIKLEGDMESMQALERRTRLHAV